MGGAFFEMDLIHDDSNRQADVAELLVIHCERSEQWVTSSSAWSSLMCYASDVSAYRKMLHGS
jgi:hypothetical protein